MRYSYRSNQLHITNPQTVNKFFLDISIEDLKIFTWNSKIYWEGFKREKPLFDTRDAIRLIQNASLIEGFYQKWIQVI